MRGSGPTKQGTGDPVAEEHIDRLRERLLDLSKRNRLLNFRHPEKSRTQARVVDELPAVLYQGLLSGKTYRFEPVPDPRDGQPGARPPIDQVARQRGIDPSFDLGFRKPGEEPAKHVDQVIQLLHYPTEMARRLEGMRQEHLTSLQELGVPALYAAFGFLEWIDQADSKTPLLSPLVLLPLELERFRERGEYRYKVSCQAEDPETNRTLAYRLRQYGGIELPSIDRLIESEDLDAYFRGVAASVAKEPTWRVRPMVTLTVLSFARQVMYEDLAPGRWASRGGRSASAILRQLLVGSDQAPPDLRGTQEVCSVEPEPKLITDADSTQVAAIADALSGRSIVVKGPPGTGKSQTITNLIAAALSERKRVLFVAEKMAALEVVKKRLDDAGLSNFCLALHSTKAKKRDVLDALARSREAHRVEYPPKGIHERQQELDRLRTELDEYMGAMESVTGVLGMTVREAVWREQELRLRLPALPPELLRFGVPGALRLQRADLEEARRRLNDVEAAVRALGTPLLDAPWRFVTTFDPLRHRAEAVRSAVERWMQTLHATLTLLAEWPWLRDSTVDDLELLSGKLADLQYVPLGAPAELIIQCANRSSASVLESLADTLERRHECAQRIAGYADPDVLLPNRSLVAELSRAIGLAGLDVQANTLATLPEAVSASRASTLALQAASDAAREAALQVGLPGPWDASAQRLVLTIARLAGQLGASLLPAREEACLEEGAAPRIQQASAEAARIRELARGLDACLTRWRDVAALEHRQNATTLRTTGFFGRLFGAGFKQARQLYLSLATGVAVPREEMAARFQEAAECLEEEARWSANPFVAATVGRMSIGRGTETDFSQLLRMSQWADSVRGALPGQDTRSRWARKVLFTADHRWLDDLVAFFESEGRCMAVAATSTDGDLGQAGPERLAALERVEGASGRVARFFDQRTSCHALAGLADACEQLADLELRIEAAQGAKAILAQHWLGARTDTGPIRRTLTAVSTLRDIELPAKVEAWLLSPTFDERVRQLRALSSSLEGALAAERRAREDAREVGVDLPGSAPIHRTFATLDGALRADSSTLINWLQYLASRRYSNQLEHLAAFLSKSETGDFSWSSLPDTFEWCLLRTLATSTMEAHPQIAQGTWTGVRLDQMRTRIRALVAELSTLRRKMLAVELASKEVPRGRGSGPRSEWTDDALLVNEIAKKSRHIPIRQLMNRASAAVMALTPCFMMSPMSVAQFLDDTNLKFDILVIDEASQLRPEDAMGALLRAEQIVIVGDEQQLPPTEFFRRTGEDGEGEPDPADDLDTESILDLSLRVLGEPRVLKWHYRSRHESLIEFSNRQFYDGKLVVAPAPRRPGDGVGVQLRAVRGLYEASTNEPEATSVVETVLELIRTYPQRSIGVVALNQQQSDLIREKFDAVAGDAESVYVERWRTTLEPFFVKNLENVQGDERDIIVVSMTFGPDASGRVFQRFGPITGANGHRRLNVLFSRAKHQLIVVSSMRADQVTPGPGAQRGPHVLRQYLEYAAAGGARRASHAETASSYTRLEHELVQMGFDVDAGVGAQTLTLDLGVREPGAESEYALAVEVDAGGWSGSGRGRDRDGTRPMVLEGLGWSVASTWTADWLREPGGARKRVFADVGTLLNASGRSLPPPRAVVTTNALDDSPAFVASSSESPKVTILLQSAGRTIGRYEVTGARIRIGRGRTCEILVPDAIDAVSSLHAELIWTGGMLTVFDRSRNGTYLDGRLCSQTVLEPSRLYVLGLGSGQTTAVIHYGAAPVAAPSKKSELGLPVPVDDGLNNDERHFLALLRKNGGIKSRDLATQLGRSPVRVNGMIRELRKKLKDAGAEVFIGDPLPDGDILFRPLTSAR